MPYNVGDRVVHPSYGVGYVIRLEARRFAEAEARLYYEITIEKGTVWVPVEPHDTNGLRPVTTREDLAGYRRTLRSRPAALNQDRRLRQSELTARLRQGSFQTTCEVVRDLTARSWNKALGDTEMTLLHRVQDNLCHEWAMAQGVSVAEATQEVQALLEEARQAYRV